MIHTTLDKLPLSRFIDMCNGDLNVIVKSGKPNINDLEVASERLINEYMIIIGSNSVKSDIIRKSEMVELMIYINVLGISEKLIGLNEWDKVCDILKKLGYSLSPDNTEMIKMKVKSILATKRYQFDKLESNIDASNKDTKKDPDYFIKEIAIVMTHFKMQIDKAKIMTKEYAYIVKRMSDEVNASLRAMKKRK